MRCCAALATRRWAAVAYLRSLRADAGPRWREAFPRPWRPSSWTAAGARPHCAYGNAHGSRSPRPSPMLSCGYEPSAVGSRPLRGRVGCGNGTASVAALSVSENASDSHPAAAPNAPAAARAAHRRRAPMPRPRPRTHRARTATRVRPTGKPRRRRAGRPAARTHTRGCWEGRRVHPGARRRHAGAARAPRPLGGRRISKRMRRSAPRDRSRAPPHPPAFGVNKGFMM